MKRLIIVLGLVLLLSGCRYQSFEYGSSQLTSSSEYEDIIDMIIEEGNYSVSEKGPYSRFHLFLEYQDGKSVVAGLNVSVFREYDGTESIYDTTDCFDVDGELSCKEHKSTMDGDRITPEVGLKEAYEKFSSIDINDMIAELQEHFNIYHNEGVIVHFSFILGDNIEQVSEMDQSSIYFYDDVYHYDEEYFTTDLMLRVRIAFLDSFAEHGGHSYSIYMEIDN